MSDVFAGLESQLQSAQSAIAGINGTTAPYQGWQNPNIAFQRAQIAKQRGLSQQCQIYNVSGTANIALPRSTTAKLVKGESTINLNLPYTFVQKPTFVFGFELGPNQYARAGAFPEGTACVSRWVTQLSGNATMWEGATIIVCASGPPNLILTLHYSFTGLAMSPLPKASTGTGTAS